MHALANTSSSARTRGKLDLASARRTNIPVVVAAFFLVAAELVGRTNCRAAALLNKDQKSKNKDGCIALVAVVQLTEHENL